MTESRDVQLLAPGAQLQRPEKAAIAIFLVILLWVVGGNVVSSLSPDNFHEEMRILYHFDAARTNSKDYAGQFLSQFPQPLLYVALTKAAIGAGIDLVPFHRWLGLVCSLLLLAGAALSGWRVGGVLAAVVTTVLIAAQPFYHYQISSATPHAFAFPLLMWALVFLLYDRPYFLAALTVLSGLLYPPISPVLGLALAWQLLVTRKVLNGTNRQRVASVLVLGVTAAISLALLWHQLAPIEGYGATLQPGLKVDIYPENGPDGRHFLGVFHPVAYVLAGAIGQFHKSLPVLLIVFVPISMVAVAGLGVYYLRHRPEYLRPLLSFIVPSVIFCVLITLLRPYIAYRFLLYPLFTVLPLLFVYGLLTLCYSHSSVLRYPAVMIVVLVAPLALSFSGAEGHRSFSPLTLDEPSNKLMAYLRQSPPDSLIAAWPGGKQTSLIPYVAGRPVFVDYKAHYPTYEGHIENMRARMFDLIDAFLAKDRQLIINLRCRWQVDYLVIDRALFSGDGAALKYFAPFNERVKATLGTTQISELYLLQKPSEGEVFSAGKYSVLDLELIAQGSDCPIRE